MQQWSYSALAISPDYFVTGVGIAYSWSCSTLFHTNLFYVGFSVFFWGFQMAYCSLVVAQRLWKAKLERLPKQGDANRSPTRCSGTQMQWWYQMNLSNWNWYQMQTTCGCSDDIKCKPKASNRIHFFQLVEFGLVFHKKIVCEYIPTKITHSIQKFNTKCTVFSKVVDGISFGQWSLETAANQRRQQTIDIRCQNFSGNPLLLQLRNSSTYTIV